MNQGPDSVRAIGAFLFLILAALLLCSQTRAGQAQSGPFQTRDQNPFSLVYGQPLPVSAYLPGEGRAVYAIALDIANTLNIEEVDDESLLLDFESYQLTTSFSYGLADNWALKIDIPLIHRDSGFLDRSIDRWHALFGLPRAKRSEVPDNQFGMVYGVGGLADVDISASSGGIGDIQLSIGRQLGASDNSAVSLWVSVDLPTGDRDTLTGNGNADYALWVAAENRLNARWAVDANAGVVLPGESVIDALQTRPAVAFGHAGLRWSIVPMIDLKLQLAAHSAYYRGSKLDMIGQSYILVFGDTVRLGRCSALDIGVSEDIKVGASPDVSFLASWVSDFGDCGSANR